MAGLCNRMTILVAIWILIVKIVGSTKPLLDKLTTECELEALSVGTRLADRYNMYDEQTEWDTRIHNDYVVQHLGFAGWIQMGTYKNTRLTAEKQDAPALHRVYSHQLCCISPYSSDVDILKQKGGWAGSKNISESAYWPLKNQWIYMMGDSTQRQVWAAFVSPFQSKIIAIEAQRKMYYNVT